MSTLVRFGISLDKELLDRFDTFICAQNYSNRSEAIRDLIRESLVRDEWIQEEEIAGTITLVYDHHQRELVNTLIDIQHDFHQLIISTQHIHLDHHNCMEIVVVKGKPAEIKELSQQLKAKRGVKHCSLGMATTGKELK
ncbi:nickel-responsive transcriptional regulator NikR [Candidatus Desantisbacteria bacterium]|nr:nickel-responsive transcriptional regulator NikR [Candidatus Desantisbacteria bacterium]